MAGGGRVGRLRGVSTPAAQPLRPTRDGVVLVHGIWMAGITMVPLQRRLQRAGFEARVLAYPSLRATPEENARVLERAVRRLRAPRVHLVGHSLGGIVVMHLLARGAPPNVGRAVLLGSPVAGSAVAHLLARSWWTRHLLGQSTQRGLLGEAPHGDGRHAVGVIAGTLPLGVGRLVPGLAEPHDGTVALEETRLPGAAASLALPVSHTGMLVARSVSEAVVAFLRAGAFPRAPLPRGG